MKTNAFSKSKLLVGFIIASALTLAGCNAATPEPVPTSTPTATLPPTATATLEPTLTPTATITPTPDPVTLAARYLAGELADLSDLTAEQREALDAELVGVAVEQYEKGELSDLSRLDAEQRAAFSVALAEKRNEAMGINFVSFTSVRDEKYYLDPQTWRPIRMPADPSDEFYEQNSFKEIYLPVEFDAEGNVMFTYNGETRTVPNSAGFDFSMEITDPHDPRLEFPIQDPLTEGKYAGLTPLQQGLIWTESGFGTQTIRPVVPLKDQIGEIVFKSGKAFRRESIFPILTFETDTQGKPLLAKTSMALAAGAFLLGEEGQDTMIMSIQTISEYQSFWETLEANQIYYLAIANDPEAVIDYASHMSDENIEGISLGHTKSEDVPVIVGSWLIKRKID